LRLLLFGASPRDKVCEHRQSPSARHAAHVAALHCPRHGSSHALAFALVFVPLVGGGLGAHLLETADEDLESCARKVKRLFLDDVTVVRDTGTCPDDLWLLFRTVGLIFKADVQELEGVNSMIKGINSRCPNLTLPLLDARIKIKKALGFGARGAAAGWLHRREWAAKLLVNQSTTSKPTAHRGGLG
jgi:hypothetical protein